MQTYPLESLTIEQAKQLQFRLVDIITRHFDGQEILSLGDLGVVKGLNKPSYTGKVEEVLAEFFGVDRAMLVRGAGTGALRFGFGTFLKPGSRILVHDAPIYPTTNTTFEMMGIRAVKVDFHNHEELSDIIRSEHSQLGGALIQHTRQKLDDYYDLGQVVSTMKQANPDLIIITDDNYAALKVERIGVQYGADLSTFSLFKLLGPEGIGLLLGKGDLVDQAISLNYSGGSQVQGYEAVEALRGLVYAPVMLAIQAEVNTQLVNRLNGREVEGVKRAFLANAQSKVLLVELDQPIAQEVLDHAKRQGAAPHPVGAESKYEFVPMFYRVSGTFLQADPSLANRMIRINPLRSGADTVIRILQEAVKKAKK